MVGEYQYKGEIGSINYEEITESGKLVGWIISYKGFIRKFLIGEELPEWAWLLVPGNEILPEMWSKFAEAHPESREYAMQFAEGSKTLPGDLRSAQLLMILACDATEDDKILDGVETT